METVKVVCPENKRTGYKIINKADMTKDDVLFDDQPKKRGPKPRKAEAK